MLSKRQKEIMDLVIQGYSPKGIMDKLKISKGCVNCHMINIYNALGIYRENGKDIKTLAIRKYLKLDDDIYQKYEAAKNQYKSLLDRYKQLLDDLKTQEFLQ